ncbi:MAG: hypothetical protein AB2693_19275 [Candidatus Thiodiazotropha sp.]
MRACRIHYIKPDFAFFGTIGNTNGIEEASQVLLTNQWISSLFFSKTEVISSYEFINSNIRRSRLTFLAYVKQVKLWSVLPNLGMVSDISDSHEVISMTMHFSFGEPH